VKKNHFGTKEFRPWSSDFRPYFTSQAFIFLYQTMPDLRRVVGGSVWARAEAVSRDAKRIYGSEVGNTWLHGTVLEVLTGRKNATAKRATTYVKATYHCGNTEKVVTLPLQVLKDKDPRVLPVAPPVLLNHAAAVNEFVEPDALPLLPPPPPPPPVASAAEQGENVPVATCNGRNWYEGITDVEMNGPVPCRIWKMICQFTGNEYTPGCDNAHDNKYKFTAYDFFLSCFPKDQLKSMVELTSASLRDANKQPTSVGELLKWFGITILITRFEFGQRSSLWSKDFGSKYIPSPSIGERTGMARERYDLLLQHMVWSYQPHTREEGMSSENYRWMLVTDFVERINNHRKKFFTPSSTICVDESISRWYGLGGHWINMGLPMYVAMDRKPEDGCEIQDACCGKSAILMQIKLVKTARANQQAQAGQQQADAGGAVADENG
jgi:Transposase IS4